MTKSKQTRTSEVVSGDGRYSDHRHSRGLSSGNKNGGER